MERVCWTSWCPLVVAASWEEKSMNQDQDWSKWADVQLKRRQAELGNHSL